MQEQERGSKQEREQSDQCAGSERGVEHRAADTTVRDIGTEIGATQSTLSSVDTTMAGA